MNVPFVDLKAQYLSIKSEVDATVGEVFEKSVFVGGGLVSSFEKSFAECYNVNLGIEPELANVVNSATKAKLLIDEMKSTRLKIIFDAANLFEVAPMEEQRAIISSSIDLLAPHIIMAHAKDRMPDGAFTVAGQGCLDYAHYIACLRSIGFDGALVTHGLAASDAMAVSQFLKGITRVA